MLAELRNASEVTIHFGPVLNAIDTHDFLRVIDPIKNAPVAYP